MSQMAYGPSGLQTAVAKLLILHFSYRTDEPSVRVTRSLSNTHTIAHGHITQWQMRHAESVSAASGPQL